MGKCYIPSTIVIALALSPSCATAQYRGDCASICAQKNSFARQSRGDAAFVQELLRLDKECQACQMQTKWKPAPTAPPPQIEMPRFDDPLPQQKSSVLNSLFNVFNEIGSWWQGPTITGAQALSPDVQQRNIRFNPSASALEKLFDDPWRKPTAAAQPSPRTFEGSNLGSTQSLNQLPKLTPATPTVSATQTQLKGCSVNQLSMEFNCPSTFPAVK